MNPVDSYVLDPVVVFVAKCVVCLCLGATAVVLAGALCGGGAESESPAGPEPQQADVPSSIDF